MLPALSHLFFPNICYSCYEPIAENLKCICTNCIIELPQTKFWVGIENEAEKKFWGKIKLEKAMSFLYFHAQGEVQNLIHHFKYQGVTEIGVTLGEWAAQELSTTCFFDDIDFLIPIPIHENKRAIRGFNQSDYIADGVSNITQIETKKELLVKHKHTSSQTRKTRFERWKNVKYSFELIDNYDLRGKHILLIDDVLTTGSTVEAAATAFSEVENLKLSLLTMAITY